jgi:hypothetical protein
MMKKLIIVLVILIVLHYYNKKKKSSFENVASVALITLMYKPKNVESWLKLHRSFGISHFYIRLENTPELIDYLKSQPDVTLMVADASKDKNHYSSLQDRQTDTMNKVIQMCKEKGITFLIHIDCDEILSGNINEIMNLPNNVGTFWMQNYEAVYEDIPTESDNCFTAKYYRDCSKEYCASYINGKGGCRVSADGVSANGPHRFKSRLKETQINIIVQHYESCDFNQYIKKYTRLSKDVNLDSIPFDYYKESILANGSTDKLKNIYRQYRVAS